MKNVLLLATLICSISSFGQSDTLINISIATGAKIILAPTFVDSLTQATQSSVAGRQVSSLPVVEPSADLIRYSRFTTPKLAEKVTLLSWYPASTTVQLLMRRNGELLGQCSGNLVAPDLVLSAAHCFIDKETRKPAYDEIIVTPAATNAIDDHPLACHAQSAYLIKRFLNDGKSADVMLLRLNEPLGDHTGWVGISSQQDSAFIRSTLFHKFSFPNKVEDLSASATRRQLHYSYGFINELDANTIGITSGYANATPGQSGSSFLYFNGTECYSIGVAIYSRMYRHQRITTSIFNALKPVIEGSIANANTLPFVIYPNPIRQSAALKVAQKMRRYVLVILSGGEVLRTQTGTDTDLILFDRGNLLKGDYSFSLIDDLGREARGILRLE